MANLICYIISLKFMMIYYIIKIVFKEFLKMKNKEFDVIKAYVDQIHRGA